MPKGVTLPPPDGVGRVLQGNPRTTGMPPGRAASDRLNGALVGRATMPRPSGARKVGRADTTPDQRTGLGCGLSTDRTPALHGSARDARVRRNRTSTVSRSLKLELQLQSPV